MDKVLHEANAFGILHYIHLDAIAAQVILGSEKRPVLSHDDSRDFIKHNGAAAHGTRRKRRVYCAVPVNPGGQSPRIPQTVHLAMIDGASRLYPAVMTAAY